MFKKLNLARKAKKKGISTGFLTNNQMVAYIEDGKVKATKNYKMKNASSLIIRAENLENKTAVLSIRIKPKGNLYENRYAVSYRNKEIVVCDSCKHSPDKTDFKYEINSCTESYNFVIDEN
jgi:hypothetical protein